MRTTMTRFSIVFLLGMIFSAPAHAFGNGTGLFEDLEFVTGTNAAVSGNAELALCHTTDDIRLLGYTLLSNITGYALATENCDGEVTRRLNTNDIRAAKTTGLIPDTVPLVAKNDVRRNLTNYGLWIAIILGLVAVIIRRVKALLGYDLRGPIRRMTTQRIISAMCHVGQCDGIIDSREIALIRKTAQRLTRRSIRSADIVKSADKTKDKLTEADFIAFGRGLRDGEKDLMMRGVFYVALASGRLYPAEYDFLTGLAHGIGMPGEDFRRVMNIALGDLDLYPPASP